MIDRVLIAEDHESANISIQAILQEAGIRDIEYVYYCDDALLKISTCKSLGRPFDLLITDLYFDEDHRPQRINDGLDLIAAAREVQPEIKVLVFSAENKATTLETLFNKLEVDGYVRKARHDSKELKMAIEAIGKNQRYLPRHIQQIIRQKNSHDFTEFDIAIISLLASGVRQKDIPAHLIERNIYPNGLSSIEKRLNHIKTILEFSKNEQLVAFCKDVGVI